MVLRLVVPHQVLLGGEFAGAEEALDRRAPLAPVALHVAQQPLVPPKHHIAQLALKPAPIVLDQGLLLVPVVPVAKCWYHTVAPEVILVALDWHTRLIWLGCGCGSVLAFGYVLACCVGSCFWGSRAKVFETVPGFVEARDGRGKKPFN